MKPGDVFKFRYHDMKGQNYTDLYWCFDGQLVATETSRGLMLVDTYWHGSENRTFTPEQAEKEGELTFVCNMGEVDFIKDYELRYYDKADLFDLSHQHNCYKRYAKRKGAPKSKEAMRQYLYAEMKEAREKIESAVRRVEWIARNMQIVEEATDPEKLFI